MADIFTKEKRSEVMSRIRGRDTKLEVSFRKTLYADLRGWHNHIKGDERWKQKKD